MVRINEHYLTLRPTYLFSEIARRVKAFAAAHPDARLIRLGIGDVTLPLAPTVVRAMHEAVDEMARAETFRGYGPETGYEFLTELIAAHDYGARGVRVATDEIFVSDGAKSDTGNIQEIFAADARGGARRPRVPRLRGHQRHGRPGGHGRAPTGGTRASSICPRPPRTASGRPSRTARSTSSISATRTTRPAR